MYLYDIRPANGVGLFLQPKSPYKAAYKCGFKKHIILLNSTYTYCYLIIRNCATKLTEIESHNPQWLL